MKINLSIDIDKTKYDSVPTQEETLEALNKGIKYGLDAKGIANPLDVKVCIADDDIKTVEELKIQKLVSSYTELSDIYKDMWQEAKVDAERFTDISFGMTQDVMDEIKSVNDYRELSIKRAKESGEELDEGGIKFALTVLHNVLGKIVKRIPTNKGE